MLVSSLSFAVSLGEANTPATRTSREIEINILVLYTDQVYWTGDDRNEGEDGFPVFLIVERVDGLCTL